MRLLFIDVCARNTNPTSTLIPALLRLNADVVCYGPGFVDEGELNGGISKFVEKHNGFDFHVMTLLSTEFRESDIRYFGRYTCPSYAPETIRAFIIDVAAFLKRTNVPKIVFLTLDAYALSEKNARLIAETNGHLVAFAGGFSRSVSELDLDIFTSEEFYARKHHLGLGRWHDVIAKYEHKFINLGHFVAETEFNWTSLDRRRRKVAVPGQIYTRRRAARRKLVEQGFLARSGSFKFLMSAMDHIGMHPYPSPLWHSLYNQTFFQNIAAARYAYTEGSGYDRPIRKYFEIPALGTILFCTPCAGFEKLGFADRKNAIVVEPDAIGDVVEWLGKSPAQAQEIADAGRKLIWDRHSLHARAEQFARCLKSIVAGRYRGSRWDDGEFIVNECPQKSGSSH